MAFFDMFFWWYSKGWVVFIGKIKDSLASVVDFFSMDSLVRTLFKPFRQISAGSAEKNAAIDAKFQMFVDRLISRLVGFFSRLVLLFVGLVLIVFGGLISLILIVLWPILPLLPIIGVTLTLIRFVL